MVLKTDIIPPRYETNVVLYYFLYYEKNSNKFLGISSFVAFEPWNVYACSQPDESSVYSVLNMINYLGNDAVETLWINLREEPSVYHRWKTLTIAISTASHLFTDESFITRNRVENMEKSLKKDVAREAHQDAGSNILVHDEESLQHVWITIQFTTL